MESEHISVESSTSTRVKSSTSDSDDEGESEPTLPSSCEGGNDPSGPRKWDVLLGRGKPFQNFSGNKRMLRIVSQFKGEYALKPRDQKRLYVESALEAVLKDGARFLQRVEVGDGSHRWEEVDRAAAAEKVWNALRSKGESRSRKSKCAADQADDHPRTPVSSLVDERGENSMGSKLTSGQPPPIDGCGISQSMEDRISLVQSLSIELIQHLSNAVSTAALLSAIATGQRQLPQAPSPTAESIGMPVAPDLLTQGISQLLSACFPGTAPTLLSVPRQPKAQHMAGDPTVAGIPVAALRGHPSANAAKYIGEAKW